MVLDLSAKPAAGFQGALVDYNAGVNVGQSAADTAGRGNAVTFEMFNPGCLPKDTLGYDKPQLVGEAVDGMAAAGPSAPAEPPLQ